MIKKSLLVASLLALALPVSAQTIATVNGKTITKAQADALIKDSGQPDNPDLRDQARNMLIDRELVMQEAARRKVLAKPQVQAELEEMRVNILVGAVMEEFIQTNGVTDAEVQEHLAKLKAKAGDKEYHAHHILVETEDEAKTLLGKIKAGEKFEDLARQSSKDPGSAPRGGDLNWANPTAFVPEFGGALKALHKGEMTETPVKTMFGYHIIRVDDVREPQMPPLSEVKTQLLEELQQDQRWQSDKFKEMVQQLRAKAKIQ